MKKNFLQDVVPANQKRSIRDIPLPEHKKSKATPVKKTPISKTKDVVVSKKYSPDEESDLYDKNHFNKSKESVFEAEYLNKEKYEDTDEDIETNAVKTKKTGSSFFKKMFITVFIIFIVAIVGLIFLDGKAIVTLYPQKTNSNVDISIPMDSTNPTVTKTQIVKNISKTVPATSEQQVEKQASGRIKILNSYKQTTQELVKNTRFKSQNGLIYRIRDSIVIPGYTMNGSQIIPGSLEVEVFADSAGEEYNISKSSFTIPGFEGKDQYTKITAETVSEISGGYIGLRKVLSQETKDAIADEFKVDLKNQIDQTKNQSTEYILIPDISTISFGDIQDKTEGDSVVLTMSASSDGYSFVKKDLFNFIGQKSILNPSANDQFSIETKDLNFSIDKKDIKIEGPTVVTWITDVEKLKKDLIGKKKTEATSIFDSYTSFKNTSFETKPFWKTKFPSDVSKIEVIIAE